jgi:cytoskeleton protein RodZ
MGAGPTQETTAQKITATAAGVVAGVTLLAAVIGISSTSSSILAKIALDPSPDAGVKSAPVIAPQAKPAQVSPAQRAPLPAVQGKSRIVIQAKQGSWIDACADGRTVLRRYLAPSSAVEVGFSNAAVVRTGNAGGVNISVNGTPTGPVGAAGEVRVMQFDAKGFHLLEQDDPGTECGQ